MKRGLVLGKFMPPHAGHVTLVQSARALVDELTVLLCSLPDDPIPGETRLEWMQGLFPDCRVLLHPEPAPQNPEGDRSFREVYCTPHPPWVTTSDAKRLPSRSRRDKDCI